ncbi:MAG: family transporter [Solirubrobacterales bacterium]|nr:family transporter [Solirubrobacterales bacterium]
MTREATEAEAEGPVAGPPPPPEDVPEEASEGPSGRAVPPVIVPRWVQLVLLPMALLALWAIVTAAGSVLLIFITAGLIALVLNPLVKLVERTRVPRTLAVAAVYLGFLLIAAGVVALLITPVSNQVSNFQKDVPHLVDKANKRLADFQNYLDKHNINVHIKKQGQTALQTLQKGVLKRSGAILSFTRDLVQSIVQALLALVVILVLSVYFLIYAGDVGRLVRRIMPPGDGTPEDDYPLLAQKALSHYIRGQFLFSVAMGTGAGVALWITGLVGLFPDGGHYALFFGAFFGLMELIPYVGPVLGAAPPVLVALFENPITALWIVLIFIGIQQLEGHVVAPQIFGHSLRINPILVIFALLFGFEVNGILGALLALPIASVLRTTVVYLRRHLVFEPWSTPSGAAVLPGIPLLEEPPPRPRGCPSCGRAVQPGDDFCRTCGEPLTRRADPPG